MRELEINRINLIKLLRNLKEEDRKELKNTFKKNYVQKFIDTTLGANEKYFFADNANNPLAIGGVEEKYVNGLRIGQVWLISSNAFTKGNLELIKFIKNKIDSYKTNYDILFNFIYKSNYKALKWLTKCGFSVWNINNKNYKLFYFTKGGINFDLRYIAR